MAKRAKLKAVDYEMTEEELREFRFPEGVATADISKQVPVSKWMPVYRYYYKDYEFECRDCGKQEVWTVAQQRRWYEEQGGSPESVAIRCRDCRRKRKDRTEQGGGGQAATRSEST